MESSFGSSFLSLDLPDLAELENCDLFPITDGTAGDEGGNETDLTLPTVERPQGEDLGPSTSRQQGEGEKVARTARTLPLPPPPPQIQQVEEERSVLRAPDEQEARKIQQITAWIRELDVSDLLIAMDHYGLNPRGSTSVLRDRMLRYQVREGVNLELVEWDTSRDERQTALPLTVSAWWTEPSVDEVIHPTPRVQGRGPISARQQPPDRRMTPPPTVTFPLPNDNPYRRPSPHVTARTTTARRRTVEATDNEEDSGSEASSETYWIERNATRGRNEENRPLLPTGQSGGRYRDPISIQDERSRSLFGQETQPSSGPSHPRRSVVTFEEPPVREDRRRASTPARQLHYPPPPYAPLSSTAIGQQQPPDPHLTYTETSSEYSQHRLYVPHHTSEYTRSREADLTVGFIPFRDTGRNRTAHYSERVTRCGTYLRTTNITFDGTGSGGDEFLRRMMDTAEMHGLMDDEILGVLPYALKGQALDWFRADRGNSTQYVTFVQRFRLRYSSLDVQTRLWEEIRERTQGMGESISSYLTSLQILFSHLERPHPLAEQLDLAFGNLNPKYMDHLDRAKIGSFDEFLVLGHEYETKLRHMARYLPPKGPEGKLFPSAAYSAKSHRRNERIAAVEQAAECPVKAGPVAPSKNQAARPAKKVQDTGTQTLSPPPDALPPSQVQRWGACFNCKEEGHFVRRCPHLLKRFGAGNDKGDQ